MAAIAAKNQADLETAFLEEMLRDLQNMDDMMARIHLQQHHIQTILSVPIRSHMMARRQGTGRHSETLSDELFINEKKLKIEEQKLCFVAKQVELVMKSLENGRIVREDGVIKEYRHLIEFSGIFKHTTTEPARRTPKYPAKGWLGCNRISFQ